MHTLPPSVVAPLANDFYYFFYTHLQVLSEPFWTAFCRSLGTYIQLLAEHIANDFRQSLSTYPQLLAESLAKIFYQFITELSTEPILHFIPESAPNLPRSWITQGPPESRGNISDQEEHGLGHSTKKRIPCDECDKSFKNNRSLQAHKLRKHSPEGPHQCDFCPRLFTRRSDLNQHRSYHINHYRCYQCDKRFARKFNLKEHLLSHSGKRQCDQCGFSFAMQSSLERHKRGRCEANTKTHRVSSQ